MDTTPTAFLYHAADLAIRATTADSTASTTSSTSTATSTSSADSNTRPAIYKTVGICLAVASGLFIGVSFVLKKVGLLKANVKYNEEAGEGYGYLKNAYWWGGMTLMIVGEICNFVAYAFTDAILVTPLGALTVVITTILSAIFLKERLSFVGKVGCFMCIVGSVIIPLNAPEQSAVGRIQEMQHYVLQPGFLVYAGVIIVGCVFTAWWVAPRYGKKSMLVYLSICSLIGGISVVSTQGLGSAILAQINGEAQFNQWFTYVLFAFVIATLLTEIIYLNKALNLFNAALVTPTYYVYFTTSTLVASAVLFQGFHGTATQIVDVVLGFLVICCGVVLLQLAKSSKDVPDTAVFAGDLDQVRTVAEQEEPESEPRADTIRGGAGIVRAMSKIRTKRQVEEVKRIHEERMEQIGEGEEVEWDGLRRRKTVNSHGRSATGSVSRTKTAHPPLGMSYFPPSTGDAAHDDEEDRDSVSVSVSEPDSDLHPGFFGRIGRKSVKSRKRKGSAHRAGTSPVPLSNVQPTKIDNDPDPHVYGLPADLRRGVVEDGDTEYKGAIASPHIHFVGHEDAAGRDRAESRGSSLAPPPPPPPHSATRRQFSFQDFIHRRRDHHSPHDDSFRPLSRGAPSFASRPSTGRGTEEEQLGLVTASESRLPEYEEERRRSSSEEWQRASAASSSPEVLGGDLGRRSRSRDPYLEDKEEDGYGEEVLRTPLDRDGRL